MTVVEETNEELPNFAVSFVNDLIALRPAKATKSTNRVVRTLRPISSRCFHAQIHTAM